MNIYYNEESLEHKLYPIFSEKPQRLSTLLKFVQEKKLPLIVSREATQKEVNKAHSQKYIDHVKSLSQQGAFKAFISNTLSPYIQWYTRVSKGSYKAALVSAGGVCQAVEDVLTGNCKTAFCIARPPGHHAGIEKGEGFCIFNNIAIGALTALEKGAKRVAIIDFDRHHGNGTEEIVKRFGEDNILFISSYQDGCKYATKNQENKNIIHIPIPEHSDFKIVQKLYEEKAITALQDFKPDLILISAGFDMHIDDPLTNIKLKSKDFFALTNIIVSSAKELCDGRIVSSLEGGYDVKALKECVGYHMEALSF